MWEKGRGREGGVRGVCVEERDLHAVDFGTLVEGLGFWASFGYRYISLISVSSRPVSNRHRPSPPSISKQLSVSLSLSLANPPASGVLASWRPGVLASQHPSFRLSTVIGPSFSQSSPSIFPEHSSLHHLSRRILSCRFRIAPTCSDSRSRSRSHTRTFIYSSIWILESFIQL